MKTKGLKEKKKRSAGIHLVADFWCEKIPEDPLLIKKILYESAFRANNTPLKFLYHRFQPQGFTAVLLLKESHLSLHSWPELNYLAIDIFTCGKNTKPHQALKYLQKFFQPRKIKVKELFRG